MKLTTKVLDDLEQKAKAAQRGECSYPADPGTVLALVAHIRELRESLLALTPGHLHGTDWSEP